MLLLFCVITLTVMVTIFIYVKQKKNKKFTLDKENFINDYVLLTANYIDVNEAKELYEKYDIIFDKRLLKSSPELKEKFLSLTNVEQLNETWLQNRKKRTNDFQKIKHEFNKEYEELTKSFISVESRAQFYKKYTKYEDVLKSDFLEEAKKYNKLHNIENLNNNLLETKLKVQSIEHYDTIKIELEKIIVDNNVTPFSLKIEENEQEIEKLNNELQSVQSINEFNKVKTKLIKEYNQLISGYLIYEEVAAFQKEYDPYFDENVQAEFPKVYAKYKKLDDLEELNNEYVKKEINNNKHIFEQFNGYQLDKQQKVAIVTDDKITQVIAGAGSGKTTTINAKLKYLIETKKIEPQKILCMSFTKASVETLKAQNRHYDVDFNTFHKLGLKVLDGQPYTIANDGDLAKVINEYIVRELHTDCEMMRSVLEFFSFYISPIKSPIEFNHEMDHKAFLNTINLRTLKSNLTTYKDERVKSQEELFIANFLFLNGIEYEYEYRYDNNLSYRPDFYLPEYNLYWEHFGITEDYKVPWLNEKNAAKYVKDIHWKRNLHKERGTKLIESYSYNFSANTEPIEILTKILKENNIKMRMLSQTEMANIIKVLNTRFEFREFRRLIETFINLYKGKHHLIDAKDIYSNLPNEFDKRSELFIAIVEVIAAKYISYLNKNNKLDFNDMINNATNQIIKNDIYFDYEYIIIDEFQDTSHQKTEFVKAILKNSDARLFVVGDDWQSIYRFAGSDINNFINLENSFGRVRQLKLEQTYRNSQQLIDVASDFVLKNPLQIPKKLMAHKKFELPISLHSYYDEDDINIKISKKVEQLWHKYPMQTILILGRNNHDINILSRNLFSVRGDNVVLLKNSKIKIKFLTVHRAKGLEAANVILLNVNNQRSGFPNQIVDDTVLQLINKCVDTTPFAEERRLFYVAITRTLNEVHLFSEIGKVSPFVEEIKQVPNVIDVKGNNLIVCPECGSEMVLKRYELHKYYKCSNHPICESLIDYSKTMLLKNHTYSGYIKKAYQGISKKGNKYAKIQIAVPTENEEIIHDAIFILEDWRLGVAQQSLVPLGFFNNYRNLIGQKIIFKLVTRGKYIDTVICHDSILFEKAAIYDKKIDYHLNYLKSIS